MNEIKAIETKYKGYRFRSRLEARWAVFFDALELDWEYEPQGFNIDGILYLPDFKVLYPGRDKSERHYEWFEVKGDILNISLEECEKIVAFAKHKEITILDGPPRPAMFNQIYPDGEGKIATHLGKAIDANELKNMLGKLAGSDDTTRFGFALWSSKGRMWIDDHKNYFSPTTYFGCSNKIELASEAARSARFEHGECG